MPRRSRRDPAALLVQHRVRTGCKTCRQRKIKCDEARPSCRNCSRRGLACDSGLQLKWQPEFASRGLAFGRQGCWAKRGGPAERAGTTGGADPLTQQSRCWCAFPPVRAHHFINTLFSELAESGSLDSALAAPPLPAWPARPARPAAASPPSLDLDVDLDLDLDLNLDLDLDHMLSPASSSPPPFFSSFSSLAYAPSSCPALLGADAALLDYYLVRLCPLTTPSRRCPSPFASLVVPVLHVAGHGDILRAAMALAARHRSTTADPDEPGAAAWGETATALHAGVIGALRRRLAALSAAPAPLEGTDAASSQKSTQLTHLPHDARPVPWDAQILVLMMFLCLYEIVDNCDHRWVIHLRASQDVVRRSRQVACRGNTTASTTTAITTTTSNTPDPARCLDMLASFAERFFAFQDVISRAACENAPLFGADYWEQIAAAEEGGSSSGSPRKRNRCSKTEGSSRRTLTTPTMTTGAAGSAPIDAWMGCSAALVRVLCRITDLSRRRARQAVEPAEFAAEAAALEDELELERLRLGGQDAEEEGVQGIQGIQGTEGVAGGLLWSDPSAADPLLQAAELKRRAVLLYLFCVLYDATPATPAVAVLVRAVLEGTAGLVAAGCTAGLSFPLFVAAVELDAQDATVFRPPGTAASPTANTPSTTLLSGRRLVLETLAAMKARSSLANVARTKAVIEKVWRMRDMATLDGGEAGPAAGLDRTTAGRANDWAIFVGPYSANISLA